MNETRLLISRYLDGELNDEEVAALASVLESDAAEINVLVFTSFLHAQLLDWMDQDSEQGRVATAINQANELQLTTESGQANSSSVNPADALGPSEERVFTDKRRRPFSFNFVAAAVMIAASIFTVAYVVGSRPIIVGQLTDTANCQWSTAPAGIQTGTLLQADQALTLQQGTAVITFASGAKLYMEGPASLEIDSPQLVRLISGRVAAKVPRQAVGFTVDTSLAKIVDLGTAFTLSLDAEKAFKLEVFEGLVEVQLNKRFGKPAQQPARVAAVHAVQFDIKSGDAAPVPFVEGKKMPF
jgi:hypothetical protein